MAGMAGESWESLISSSISYKKKRVRKKCISFVNCDVLSVALEVAIVEKREREGDILYICPLNFN